MREDVFEEVVIVLVFKDEMSGEGVTGVGEKGNEG